MSLWDDDENTEFRDIPDETQVDQSGQLMAAPPVQIQQPPRPVAPQPIQVPFNGATARFEEPTPSFVEELIEEVAEEESDDFSDVLSDANLRIEQGRLYQMIMNHDLFEGTDSDPRAVQIVQKKIRKIARELMEEMLGMRQPAAQSAPISSPFNALEVDILKKLASKASNGVTESAEANQIAQAVQQAPRRKALNPISSSTKKPPMPAHRASPAPAPRPQAAPQPQKALPTKAQTPVPRTKQDQIIDQILAEEGVSRADLELEYVGIGKRLNELTPEELVQRQKASASRLAARKTVKSESAIPMASPEQQAFLALERANQFKGVQKMDGLSIPGGMSALLDKVRSMPIKNPG
jgi:hypothetical protein